ncbi:calcium-binding protein [Derxia lacustris]|uniref:calcium-binding protein n=1 Tax=Derxia lacustris TaxID=764842 RepID=UPI002286F14E|nr:calcium-binding protein [Derxia lacustris]
MGTYNFAALAGTSLSGFNIASDSLLFDYGYPATQLGLLASGADTLVTQGSQTLRLVGIAPASLGGSQFSFADGSIYRQGTAAANAFAGGTAGDLFDISQGGNDSVSGNDGNDVIVAGNSLTQFDTIAGGAGNYDELRLSGNYAAVVTAGSITGIEHFVFGPGTVQLRLNAGIFSSVQGAVTFDASGQGQSDALVLDASGIAAYIDALGGAGADRLTGGNLGDSLRGGIGADALAGGAGDDTLVGGLDADTLTGGSGNDRFVYDFAYGLGLARTDSSPSTADHIADFTTGDRIDLPGINTINGKPLVFERLPLAFEYIDGNSGQWAPTGDENDGFVGVYWNNDVANHRLRIWVDGNDDGQFSEADLLIYLDNQAAGATLTRADFVDNFLGWRGTTGNDSDYGGNAGDNFGWGLAGNDTLIDDLGRDSLHGGLGNDSLAGGAGNDWLEGGDGADTLLGGEGDDQLDAEGSNYLNSSASDEPGTVNLLYGGNGNDYLYGGAGDDQLNGDAGNDQLSGDAGNDRLDGGSGDDRLWGDAGADTLLGGAGNDDLDVGGGSGSGVADSLDGGDGDDVLHAGRRVYGADRATLTGGLGADRFAFTTGQYDAAGWYDDNIASNSYSPVYSPDLVSDFRNAEGDLIRTGLYGGTYVGVPVVWRGTALAGFTGTVGQSLAAAGSDPTDTRFLELWTWYDAAANQTVLFMDRNRDFTVDSNDLKILFTGNVGLTEASFVAGTFTVKVGTVGADTDTRPALGNGADLAFGLGGNDTLNALDGDDTVNGDAGNDYLVGGTGDDRLYGGSGNDVLSGSAGNDYLVGGSGADTLFGGDDADQLMAEGALDSTGGSGTDAAGTVNVLFGGAGNDGLQGGAGNDALNGDGGDDTLDGGDGRDTLNGGDGNDTLSGAGGIDLLDGGAGNDQLRAGYGGLGSGTIDTLTGGSGDDVLWAVRRNYGGEQAVMVGGSGADRFVFTGVGYDGGGSPYDNLTSGYSTVAAPDRITDFNAAEGDLIRTGIADGLGGYNLPIVWGGSTAAGFTATLGQTLTVAAGSAIDPRFLAFWTGYDAASGRSFVFMDLNRNSLVDADDFKLLFNGQPTLNAGIFTAGSFSVKVGTLNADSNTTVALGNDADLAFGLAGNDTLNALDGNDTVNGDAGNDYLVGGNGYDLLYGGTGNDVLSGGADRDNLIGGSGADTLYGGDDADQLSAEGALDSTDPYTSGADAAGTVNVLFGGNGDDGLSGGAGNDVLNGDAGNDYLSGGDGRDTLSGGTGDDRLYGAGGIDLLDGGAGNDSLDAGYGTPGSGVIDTLTGGDGDDVLNAVRRNYGGEQALMTGGAGADRFVFASTTYDGGDAPSGDITSGFSTVAAPDRIVDFNAAEGDLIRTGIGDGLGGYNLPVVWRGAAASGFTASVGQTLVQADPRFLEFWTGYDAGSGRSFLFIDLNRNAVVDADDFKLLFNGQPALGTGAFTAGTFTVKVGTVGADGNTAPALGSGDDLAFALAGNDTLDALDGADTVNGDDGNDSLLGGLGDDRLYGGNGNDALAGGAGRDNLWGGSGADTLNGGDDSDQLSAEGPTDSTSGQSAADAAGTYNLLNGGAGADYLSGGAGTDQLNGDADDDQLYGGDGNDTLNGGDGADYLYGDAGSDSMLGGAGADTLWAGYSGGGATDTLSGGEGADVLYAARGTGGDRSVLTGGLGADRFAFTTNSSDVYGSSSSDLTAGYSRVAAPDRITDFNAAEGDLIRIDTLDGRASGMPVVWRGVAAAGFTATLGQSLALAGADATDSRYLDFWTFYDSAANRTVLFMDSNRDFVVDDNDFKLLLDGNVALGTASFNAGAIVARRGGSGADSAATLAPTEAADLLIGAKGDDSLAGLGGNDRLYANQGRDTLDGGIGDDELYGGADNDSLLGGDGRDTLYGGSGNDTLDGGVGDDQLWSARYNDSNLYSDAVEDAATAVNTLRGGIGNDTLTGGAGIDLLYGGGDNDQIYGYAGNDQLLGEGNADNLDGGDGDDTLAGGSGLDSLYGGAGADVFVFDTAPVLGNADNLWDFSSVDDVIRLDHNAMVGLGATLGTLAAARFWSGAGVTAAHDADDRIVYNTTTGELYYDADGTGATAAVLLATLGYGSGAAVDSGDFVIV